MPALIKFIILVWIINKLFRFISSIFKKSHDNTPETKPTKSRRNMDIQDAEFEDVD